MLVYVRLQLRDVKFNVMFYSEILMVVDIFMMTK